MRVGIIGGGGISGTHLRAARGIEGVEVVGVYGYNREKTAALAQEAGAAAYEDFDRFLAHPMDMVAIGSPSGLHAEQATAAVRRGLHALVEKPLDVTTAKIDALIAEADRARRSVGVIFQERLLPEVVALKSRIDGGEFGTPLFISGQMHWYRPPAYYASSKWRGTPALDGGGVLINQGIHTLDLMLHLFGSVRRVSGRLATRLHDIQVEDTAAALLEFDSGALGVFEGTTAASPGFPRRIEIAGSGGRAVYEDPPRPATVADPVPHRRVFEDFIAAVRTGRPPMCDARDGRRSVALIEAIVRSQKSGGFETP
jgi:UDP-N-acetyl-2-amino-2-deoxyglucuronate dehydrogenase